MELTYNTNELIYDTEADSQTETGSSQGGRETGEGQIGNLELAETIT